MLLYALFYLLLQRIKYLLRRELLHAKGLGSLQSLQYFCIGFVQFGVVKRC